MTPSIALCVIAKHGAVGYRRLIDIALKHVDEAVTVLDVDHDPGIKDYRSDRVTYYCNALNGNFSNQRNYLCERAKADWLLHLDTDETLHPWLWAHIRDTLRSTQADLILLPRKTTFIDRPDVVTSWPDWQPKLHRNHVRWHKPVHEWPIGFNKAEELPPRLSYAIIHRKTTAAQGVANNLYASILRVDADRDDHGLQCQVQDVPP